MPRNGRMWRCTNEAQFFWFHFRKSLASNCFIASADQIPVKISPDDEKVEPRLSVIGLQSSILHSQFCNSCSRTLVPYNDRPARTAIAAGPIRSTQWRKNR
jgi:hypothetical protein